MVLFAFCCSVRAHAAPWWFRNDVKAANVFRTFSVDADYLGAFLPTVNTYCTYLPKGSLTVKVAHENANQASTAVAMSSHLLRETLLSSLDSSIHPLIGLHVAGLSFVQVFMCDGWRGPSSLWLFLLMCFESFRVYLIAVRDEISISPGSSFRFGAACVALLASLPAIQTECLCFMHCWASGTLLIPQTIISSPLPTLYIVPFSKSPSFVISRACRRFRMCRSHPVADKCYQAASTGGALFFFSDCALWEQICHRLNQHCTNESLIVMAHLKLSRARHICYDTGGGPKRHRHVCKAAQISMHLLEGFRAGLSPANRGNRRYYFQVLSAFRFR